MIEWHPANAKHYESDASIWLCIHLSATLEIDRILLQEGSHHYFESWSVFNAEGCLIEEQDLSGPGPHCLRAKHLPDAMVIVRSRFLPYLQNPASQAERNSPDQAHRIDCGRVIHANEASQKILMLAHDLVAYKKPIAPLPHATDVYTAITNRINVWPLELRLQADERSLELVYLQPNDVLIFFLQQEATPNLPPGSEVAEGGLPRHLPHILIRAGDPSSLQPLPNPNWLVAIAVVKTGAHAARWRAAKPFSRIPLISGFKVTPNGAKRRATWSWNSHVQNLQVRLSWQIYTEAGGYEDEWGTEEIPHFGSVASETFEFFTQSLANSGKCLEVTAVPLLLGAEVPPKSTARVQLMTWS